MTLRVPLDPKEGPSAYLEITDKPDHAELAVVKILAGTDPEDPVHSVVLNEREAVLLANSIQTHFDNDTTDDE